MSADEEITRALARLAGDSIDDLMDARRRAEHARVRLLEVRGLLAMAEAELAAAELNEEHAQKWAAQHWPMFRGAYEQCRQDGPAETAPSAVL
jgi:hypothetical protein